MVASMQSGLVPANWLDLVQHSSELATDKQCDLAQTSGSSLKIYRTILLLESLHGLPRPFPREVITWIQLIHYLPGHQFPREEFRVWFLREVHFWVHTRDHCLFHTRNSQSTI
eukprot:scaffold3163_cov60-Attheya_sp.AAC.4